MIVTPLERLRYHVTSRTGKPPYLVDVGSFRRHGLCNGKCTCEDFRMNMQLLIEELIRIERAGTVGEFEVAVGYGHQTFGEDGKRFKFVPSDRTRCAHIRAARDFAFDEMLDKLVTHIRQKFDDYKGDEEFE